MVSYNCFHFDFLRKRFTTERPHRLRRFCWCDSASITQSSRQRREYKHSRLCRVVICTTVTCSLHGRQIKYNIR